MGWKRRILSGLTIGLLLVFVGCKEDRRQTKLIYMPDMVDAPVVKPQRGYLDPPEGAVSRDAMIYPPDNDPEAWERSLYNPYTGHREEAFFAHRGENLYQHNCSPCHGKNADGKGSLQDKYPPAPDLTLASNLERADGFFFHKITVGGPIMPPRDEHTSVDERWQIILHLRKLQRLAKADRQDH